MGCIGEVYIYMPQSLFTYLCIRGCYLTSPPLRTQNQSEGCPRTGYFIPACVGSGRRTHFARCSRGVCAFGDISRKVQFGLTRNGTFWRKCVSRLSETILLGLAPPEFMNSGVRAIFHQSEGCPGTGYFVPGRVWSGRRTDFARCSRVGARALGVFREK